MMTVISDFDLKVLIIQLESRYDVIEKVGIPGEKNTNSPAPQRRFDGLPVLWRRSEERKNRLQAELVDLRRARAFLCSTRNGVLRSRRVGS